MIAQARNNINSILNYDKLYRKQQHAYAKLYVQPAWCNTGLQKLLIRDKDDW